MSIKRNITGIALCVSALAGACGAGAEFPDALASTEESVPQPVVGTSSAETSLAEDNTVLAGVFGPTNSLAAQVARVVPFPNLSTAPGTEITGLALNFNFEDGPTIETGYNVDVEFTTTRTSAESVVADYSAELGELIGEEAEFYTVEDADLGVVHWADIGDSHINAFESGDGSVVSIDYTVLGPVRAGVFGAFEGSVTELDLGEAAFIRQLRVSAFADSQRYDVDFGFSDLSLQDAEGVIDASAQGAGWTVIDESRSQWASPDHSALIQTNVSQNATTGTVSALVQYVFTG